MLGLRAQAAPSHLPSSSLPSWDGAARPYGLCVGLVCFWRGYQSSFSNPGSRGATVPVVVPVASRGLDLTPNEVIQKVRSSHLATTDPMEYSITPPRGLVRVNWPELWRYRDLFLVLAWRDISVRYKQTALGVAWAVIQPVVTMVIFTFIFNRMAKIQSGDGTPYPVFLYTGQLLWQYFSGTLTNASNAMVSNASLVQKVYFPRLILPLTAATTGLVDFGVASLILAGMMVYYGLAPGLVGLLALPLLVLTAVLCSMGVGLAMASLNVKYRDVRHALPFCISILMYVTPVIYPVAMLDSHPWAKTAMVWLNPMAGVISNARAGLLGRSPFQWDILGISLLVSAVYFVIGLYYFRSTERFFADIA
jgi:lipopolysaccharide transport system permease protein